MDSILIKSSSPDHFARSFSDLIQLACADNVEEGRTGMYLLIAPETGADCTFHMDGCGVFPRDHRNITIIINGIITPTTATSRIFRAWNVFILMTGESLKVNI